MTRPRRISIRPLLAAATAAALVNPALAQTTTEVAPYTPPMADSLPPTGPQTTAPQTTAPQTGDDLEGLIGRGLDRVLNDMFTRAQPHLEGLAQDLSGLMDDYGPALKELSGLVDDIRNYDAPERLANGDIVIRRKTDAPPPPPIAELKKLAPPQGAAPGPSQPDTLPGLPPLPDSPFAPKISI